MSKRHFHPAHSIGVGASISATIGVPDIASVSTQYTVDVKFTNTQSQATSSSDSSSVTHTETVNGGNNQCSVDLTVNSCHATGTASIRTSVTGYVWFNYDSKTASADGDPDDKHYKWALSIENTLTDINDRSDTMELKTSTKGSSHATAETSCNKVAS
ncbi:hypothetical protein C8R43DRAFT_1141772 [Mycena crocata]|nr:hypothetical protein C8R43DRAFT_1141772 [Mycena crocata]